MSLVIGIHQLELILWYLIGVDPFVMGSIQSLIGDMILETLPPVSTGEYGGDASCVSIGDRGSIGEYGGLGSWVSVSGKEGDVEDGMDVEVIRELESVCCLPNSSQYGEGTQTSR
jgi:hypothetical protein